MILCPYCGGEMSDFTKPCPACGRELPEGDSDKTTVLQSIDSRPSKGKSWQSAEISDGLVIYAHIDEDVEPIQLMNERAVTLGRDKTQDGPDVDFAPYQARELGVSHLHAEIDVEGDMLLIRDLESTNGTFLNGQKIGSQGRILRHLDEVSLGGLKFIIKLDE